MNYITNGINLIKKQNQIWIEWQNSLNMKSKEEQILRYHFLSWSRELNGSSKGTLRCRRRSQENLRRLFHRNSILVCRLIFQDFTKSCKHWESFEGRQRNSWIHNAQRSQVVEQALRPSKSLRFWPTTSKRRWTTSRKCFRCKNYNKLTRVTRLFVTSVMKSK